MKNKYSEQELISAFMTQNTPELGANFVVKVMESVQVEYVWQPIFKFAALNVCLASLCCFMGFYLFDLNDLGLQLLIDSGIII